VETSTVSAETLRIDCDRCAVRDLQCGDCVMTVLRGAPGVYDVDPGEALALDVLAEQGLVPHLRLVPLGIPFREDQQEGKPDSRAG
jgi:hypothetical protein